MRSEFAPLSPVVCVFRDSTRQIQIRRHPTDTISTNTFPHIPIISCAWLAGQSSASATTASPQMPKIPQAQTREHGPPTGAAANAAAGTSTTAAASSWETSLPCATPRSMAQALPNEVSHGVVWVVDVDGDDGCAPPPSPTASRQRHVIH